MPAESTTKGDAEHGGEPRGERLRPFLVVALLAIAFALVPKLTRSCGSSQVDKDAPNFTARLVANAANVDAPPRPDAPATEATQAAPAKATLELASLRGRPVILDFWATWCGPCQAESPIVNAIAQRYRDRGLAVVGVNTSDEDGLAPLFARKKGLTFPIVYDQGNAIAKDYDVESLPTLVVISKTGKVVAVRHGVTSDSALDEIVRRQL